MTDGTGRTMEKVYETSYDGTFPIKTVYTEGNVKKEEVVYDKYSSERGRLLKEKQLLW